MQAFSAPHYMQEGGDVTLSIYDACTYGQLNPPDIFFVSILIYLPVPAAARSKAWDCGRSLAGIAGSNPTGGMGIDTSECCVLSGRGLSVGLNTRPEESYRMWNF